MSILLSKDEQRESNNIRFDPKAGSPSESILDRCQPTSGPTAEEYHVLIKKGIVKFYYLINMGTWLRRIILHPLSLRVVSLATSFSRLPMMILSNSPRYAKENVIYPSNLKKWKKKIILMISMHFTKLLPFWPRWIWWNKTRWDKLRK